MKRPEPSACHGTNGYQRRVGGVLKRAAFSSVARCRKASVQRCSRCNAMQRPSIEEEGGEVLKCGDVWPKPSVSVATLHPLPHFAIQNKQGSGWMCVSSHCHNTERRDVRAAGHAHAPTHTTPRPAPLQQRAAKHGSRCSGEEAPMLTDRYSRSVRCASPASPGKT